MMWLTPPQAPPQREPVTEYQSGTVEANSQSVWSDVITLTAPWGGAATLSAQATRTLGGLTTGELRIVINSTPLTTIVLGTGNNTVTTIPPTAATVTTGDTITLQARRNAAAGSITVGSGALTLTPT